jgi:hypothetical protein
MNAEEHWVQSLQHDFRWVKLCSWTRIPSQTKHPRTWAFARFFNAPENHHVQWRLDVAFAIR